jgi:uncharacterized iron-regulated membrane protein
MNGPNLYRTLWRWHFYAGLFCLPFIAVLAITGSIFLFKPQIDAWEERAFDHLELTSEPRPLADQVAAAQARFPQARFKGLEWRADPADAVRVLLLTPGAEAIRVYVRPDTLEILRTIPEKKRLSMIVRTIHGELLAGDAGAIFVELVGAWAIGMVLSGLYLWWPRGQRGFGGILYPRLKTGRFLRDLHAVTGVWVSVLALFFLISALPWTKVWGGGLKEARQLAGAHITSQDWTTGPASEHAMHRHELADAAPSHHEQASPFPQSGLTPDQVYALVGRLNLAAPIIVTPPTGQRPTWLVRSDSQNRMLRTSIELDSASGSVVREAPFAGRDLIDRMVGIGVAAHEGQLFGWANVALGLLTAAGFLTLSLSSVLMWWRRRPSGKLGAPPALSGTAQAPWAVIACLIVLGLALPMFGASLLAVIAAERLILIRIRPVRDWLGLAS